MSFQWKNHILLITGASNGIGAAVIRNALEEGVQQVFNLDVDAKNGVALQNELNKKFGADKVKFVQCDVTNEEQLKTNFQLVLGDKKKNYVVVNNAGIFNEKIETFRKEIDVNLTAVVAGSLLALDLMRKEKGGNGGTVINISSIAGLNPIPFSPIYSATKSGVMVFSSAIGSDEYYKRSDVRFITLCFGVTNTRILWEENMGSFDEEIEKKFPTVVSSYPIQSVESAGRAVIDVFKKGESASVWLSSNDRPVEDITDTVRQGFTLMSNGTVKN